MADLAGRQHGVVARAQLAQIGLGRGAIELRLARGRLHSVCRGVYAVGHTILRDEGRWMAAVLAGGRGAALSHGTAAAHWGIRPWDGRVEVTTRRRLTHRGVHFRYSLLPRDEIASHGGIPVTTVPRTLFDLASVVSKGQFARTVNQAEIRRLWDPLSLHDLLERHPRRPGAAAIRAVIAAPGAEITRSELEDRFIAFVERAGLPLPATNVGVQLDGGWVEVDCLWRAERLVAELDGHAVHGTRAAYEADRARDRALVAGGWLVVRVTWRQLHDDPAALRRDLAAALGPLANLRSP